MLVCTIEYLCSFVWGNLPRQRLTSTNALTQLKGIGSTRAEQIEAVKAALEGDGDGAGALVRVVLVDGTLFRNEVPQNHRVTATAAGGDAPTPELWAKVAQFQATVRRWLLGRGVA